MNIDPVSQLPVITLNDREKEYYRLCFTIADTDKDGYVSSNETVSFLQRSGVGGASLAMIWEIVNRNKMNKLGPNAFSIALKLVAMCQSGLTPNIQQLSLANDMPRFQGVEIPSPKSAMLGNLLGPLMPGAPPTSSLGNPSFHPPVNMATTPSYNPGPSAMVTAPSYHVPATAIHPAPPSSYNPPPMTMTSTQQSWVLTPELKMQYESLFAQAPKSNPNFLSGTEARDYFAKSGLNSTDLAKVWSLSDRDHDNLLDKSEFCMAMFLVKAKLSGQNLPDVVPDSLLASYKSYSSGAQPQAMNPQGSLALMSPASQDPWVVSPESQTKYEHFFNTADNNRTGRISAADARNVLARSNLPTQDLAKIWGLSDMNKDGALDIVEFCVAMHLIDCKRLKGMQIPDVLPPAILNSISANKAISGGFPTPGNTFSMQGFGSGPTPVLFGQTAQAELLAQQQRELEKERQQTQALKQQIVSKLNQKAEIITKLRNSQLQNVESAKKVAIQEEQVERTKAAVKEMEVTIERQKQLLAAINEKIQLVRKHGVTMREQKRQIDIILGQRQYQFQDEQLKLQQLGQQLMEDRASLDKQREEIIKLRNEVTNAKVLKAQAEKRRVQIEMQRREVEQRRLEKDMEERRRLQFENQQREIERQKEELRKQREVLEKKVNSTPPVTTVDNSADYKNVDDFGTTTSDKPKGEGSLFFGATDKDFPPGFYPEYQDFGTLITFSINKPATPTKPVAATPAKPVQAPPVVSAPPPVASAPPPVSAPPPSLPPKVNNPPPSLPPKQTEPAPQSSEPLWTPETEPTDDKDNPFSQNFESTPTAQSSGLLDELDSLFESTTKPATTGDFNPFSEKLFDDV